MTILLTVLCTLLALIVIAGVTVYFLAPLKISFKREAYIEYELSFGRYMKDSWIGRDWFSITKLYFDKKGEVKHADFIISWFPASKKQIDKLNQKHLNEQLDDRFDELMDYETEYRL